MTGLKDAFLLPLAEARATLDVSETDDAATVRRAYRRQVAAHPPDRDPEGFRRVRAAYERFEGLLAAADDLLDAPHPHLPPPAVELPEESAPQALTEHLIRKVLTRLSLSDLMPDTVLDEKIQHDR